MRTRKILAGLASRRSGYASEDARGSPRSRNTRQRDTWRGFQSELALTPTRLVAGPEPRLDCNTDARPVTQILERQSTPPAADSVPCGPAVFQ